MRLAHREASLVREMRSRIDAHDPLDAIRIVGRLYPRLSGNSEL